MRTNESKYESGLRHEMKLMLHRDEFKRMFVIESDVRNPTSNGHNSASSYSHSRDRGMRSGAAKQTPRAPSSNC